MEKPTLADLLGTKGYKTEQAAKSAIASTLKNKSAVGALGQDTRIAFRAASKQYWVEAIEAELQQTPPEPDKAFGARMQGGNANPPPAPRKAAAKKKAAGKRKAERVAGVAERLARVKAEASGEVVPRQRLQRLIVFPEMAEGVSGPWLLVARGWPEKADPRHWAFELSKRSKLPFDVVSAETNALACSIDAKALRPPRRGAPKRGGTPQGFDATAIELATRPGGVLRTELREKSGKGRNWFGYLKRIGERYGYSVAPDRSGPTPRYSMEKLPEQTTD